MSPLILLMGTYWKPFLFFILQWCNTVTAEGSWSSNYAEAKQIWVWSVPPALENPLWAALSSIVEERRFAPGGRGTGPGFPHVGGKGQMGSPYVYSLPCPYTKTTSGCLTLTLFIGLHQLPLLQGGSPDPSHLSPGPVFLPPQVFQARGMKCKCNKGCKCNKINALIGLEALKRLNCNLRTYVRFYSIHVLHMQLILPSILSTLKMLLLRIS